MEAASVLAALAALALLPTAAWLHPGRSRGLAVGSVLLALFPFWRAGVGAMELTDAYLPFAEAWKTWVARVLVIAVLCGLAFLASTTRIESWWPLFVVLAVAPAILSARAALTLAAAVAAVALAPIVRGGFGDPLRWRRIGAFVSLLALALVDGVLVREALIP